MNTRNREQQPDTNALPEAERLRREAGRLDDPLFAAMRQKQRRQLRATRGIDVLYALLIMACSGALMGGLFGYEWCDLPCESCTCGGWDPPLVILGGVVGVAVAAPSYRLLRARRAKRLWSG